MAVYFLQAREYGRHIKIGTSGNVEARLRSYTSLPFECDLRAVVPGDHETESTIHLIFAKFRKRGEWFEPVEAVEKLVRYLGKRRRDDPPSEEEILAAIDGANGIARDIEGVLRAPRPILRGSPRKPGVQSKAARTAEAEAQRERLMVAWHQSNIAMRCATLARFSPVSNSLLVHIVNRTNCEMSAKTAQRLAETLCVRSEWLHRGEGPMRNPEMRDEVVRRASKIPERFRRVMEFEPIPD